MRVTRQARLRGVCLKSGNEKKSCRREFKWSHGRVHSDKISFADTLPNGEGENLVVFSGPPL